MFNIYLVEENINFSPSENNLFQFRKIGGQKKMRDSCILLIKLLKLYKTTQNRLLFWS